MEHKSEQIFQSLGPWLRVLLMLLTAAAAVFALRQVGPAVAWALNIISPFLIALVIAYVFHPIVLFVQKKLKLGRVAGILVLAALIVLVLTGMVAWLAPVLYQQTAAVLKDLRASVDHVFDRLMTDHLDAAMRQTIKEKLALLLDQLDQSLNDILGQLGGLLQPVAKTSASAIRGVAGGVFHGLAALGGFVATGCFVVIITFYYLADMDQMPSIIRRLLPGGQRERIWYLMVQADRSVGGFLRGQLTACVGVGMLVAVLLTMVGMKQYAILIGFIAGLLNFIPYLGPVTGALPAILWVLMTQSLESWGQRGVWVVIIIAGFALIQMIDGFVFQPFIVGKQASLHPLAVMLALLVGAQAGIGGMIVAVPVACVVKVLWVNLYWSKRTDFQSDDKRAEPPKVQES